MFIDEAFKFFKGHKKDIKYLRMGNAGDNRAIASLFKENYVKVEYVPHDIPELNNMVDRGFAIKWETAETLI